MQILVENRGRLPYCFELSADDGSVIRELLAPVGGPGAVIDIGTRIDPWQLQRTLFLRSLVSPAGVATYTSVTGGYRVDSPSGQITITFIREPNDLIGATQPGGGGGGGGISEAQHQALRQLIHFIDAGPASGFATGAFKEVIGGLFPTEIIWWEDATKAQKIVEKIIVRTGTGTLIKPTPITWRVYTPGAGVGVLAGEVVDTITYSGVAEISRTRAINL